MKKEFESKKNIQGMSQKCRKMSQIMKTKNVSGKVDLLYSK